MSLRKALIAGAAALVITTFIPSRASADWLFTPFIGATFDGAANFGSAGVAFKTDFERNLTYGASIGYMGHGAIGFEADFGYSPNFWKSDDELVGGIHLVGDGNVTTFMGNIIVGAPISGFRPYATAGVGLIRSSVEGGAVSFFQDISRSDFGFNVGGGVMGFFGDTVGLRGDIRYFRNIHDADFGDLDIDLGDLDFWRGTAGVVFRW